MTTPEKPSKWTTASLVSWGILVVIAAGFLSAGLWGGDVSSKLAHLINGQSEMTEQIKEGNEQQRAHGLSIVRLEAENARLRADVDHLRDRIRAMELKVR